MTNLWVCHKLLQFWELASEKGEKTDPGTEGELHLKQSRWPWLDHQMTNFNMTIRDNCGILHVNPNPCLCTLEISL